jgi:putative transposase
VEASLWRDASGRGAADAGLGRGEQPLKEAGGRPGGADPNLERGKRKKMVSPSSRRRAVKVVVEEGLSSAARACRAIDLARSSFYRPVRVSPRSRGLHKQIVQLSQKHPRCGYRHITALLRQSGLKINGKRVQRLRRMAGIQVRARQRRMQRLGPDTSERLRAVRPRPVWSWDFVEDQTENGTCFRILTVLDEYTRQYLATHASWSIRAVDAIMVIEAAITRYGAPQHLRRHNGAELIAYAILDWKNGKLDSLHPAGQSMRNGDIESFHDKLRDECLNRELFGTLAEARVMLESGI